MRPAVAAPTGAALRVSAVLVVVLGVVAAASFPVVMAALPVGVRQETCPELQVPETCEALLQIVDEAADANNVSKSLTVWVPVLVVARFSVTLLDHAALHAGTLGHRLLWEIVGISTRYFVIQGALVQLMRFWWDPSRELEALVLLVAILFDVAVMFSRLDHLTTVFGARAYMTQVFGDTGDPVGHFCTKAGSCLLDEGAAGGARILRAQLLLLVQDREFVYDGFQKHVQNARSGPIEALLGVVALVFYVADSPLVFLLLVWPMARCLLNACTTRRMDHEKPLWLKRWPSLVSFLWRLPAHSRFVCINGHQGDHALAAFDARLEGCPVCVSDNHARRPSILSLRWWGLCGEEHKTIAQEMVGSGHRLLSVGHLVDAAERTLVGQLCDHTRLSEAAILERRRLAAMWVSAKGRAPLRKLVINPAVCLTDLLRVLVMRQRLGPTLEKLAAPLLFGLRALTPGPCAQSPLEASLQHGYWWARADGAALEAFESWVTVDPRVPPLNDRLLGKVPPDTSTDDPLRRLWRTNPNYSQPLLDDWGPDDRVLPPVWASLVRGRGGLAAAAVFGLQAWMVAADLAIDHLDDLYLTLGLPEQLACGRELNCGTAADAAAAADGAAAEPDDASTEPDGVAAAPGGLAAAVSPTADELVGVLQRLPAITDTVVRLLEWPDSPPPVVSRRGDDTPGEWPPALPPPPTTQPLTPAVERRVLQTLQSVLPQRVLGRLPPDVAAVYKPFRGGAAGGGDHRRLLAEWHRRWRRVLLAAADLHGVTGEARAAVAAAPLVGFFPALRVATDALAGAWEPLAAAAVARTGRAVGGWPATVDAGRLATLASCVGRCRWAPRDAAVDGLAASIFFSRTAAEGAAYRACLRVDADAESLLPRGAAPSEPATALAAAILTGYVLTRWAAEDGDGEEGSAPDVAPGDATVDIE